MIETMPTSLDDNGLSSNPTKFVYLPPVPEPIGRQKWQDLPSSVEPNNIRLIQQCSPWPEHFQRKVIFQNKFHIHFFDKFIFRLHLLMKILQSQLETAIKKD